MVLRVMKKTVGSCHMFDKNLKPLMVIIKETSNSSTNYWKVEWKEKVTQTGIFVFNQLLKQI